MKKKFVRSRITHPDPGLTKGKRYEFLRWGFYQGAYYTIINDRGEEISIYDPEKYLHTDDVSGPLGGRGRRTSGGSK